jgi:hypothetical protein
VAENVYCSRSDLYQYGLPRGALGMQGQLVASALASTSVVTLDAHGFETDDVISFRASDGDSLPDPLVEGTSYYAIRLDDSRFQVSASEGGSEITLTEDATSMIVLAPLPYESVMEFYSRWVDSLLPAENTPLAAPIPALVKGIVAELSAKKLMHLSGQTSVSVDAFEVAAKAMLERFAKGLRLRDDAQTPANTAVAVSLVVTGNDSRGWKSEVLP